MFQPKEEYIIKPTQIKIKEFHDHKKRYAIRPPYQRKSVWETTKKQALLDSIFRKYYIPRIVVREVRTGPETVKSEVVDGQQRILTVQEFFDDNLILPETLSSFSKTFNLSNKTYSELTDEIKFYLNDLTYDVDIIKGIDDPKDTKHQSIATEIFRRLQEGEPLTFMEKLHARLSSISRNFVTHYADDISFDLVNYEPLDYNPNRHKFFHILDRGNNRLEHLALLARFLLIELANGPTDIGQKQIEDLIIRFERPDGIGKVEFDSTLEKRASQEVLKTLNLFYEIFSDDITIDKNNGVKELSTEYFIVSMYMLLKHIRYLYVVDEEMKIKFKEFLYAFYQRYKTYNEADEDIFIFRDKRQQDEQSVEIRDKIVRQSFFEFSPEAKRKDTQRSFNESQRIKIFRRDKGLCQICLKDGLNEEQAKISWSSYQADHIIAHAKGAPTIEENAQVLCSRHNAMKSNK